MTLRLGKLVNTLPTFGRISRASRLYEPEDMVYKGAYAKLMGFLEECRESGCDRLTQEKYQTLTQAVDSLTQRVGNTSKKLIQEHLKGHEMHSGSVLGSLGIDLREEDEVTTPKSKSSSSTKPLTLEASMMSMQAQERVSTVVGSNLPSSSENKDVLVLTRCFCSPFNLFDRYSIKADKIAAWMLSIAAQYQSVPYHNWRHAMDVFFFSYYCLVRGQADRLFNFQDILALHVSGLAHDVGHFGMTNTFLVSTRSKLALTYNDQSVLENMHASKCFVTMLQPGMNFLESMSTKDFNLVRQKTVGAILATDMVHHFEFVDRFSARVNMLPHQPFVTDTKDTNDPSVKERRKASKDDRRMLLQAFMHMADLGKNCGKFLAQAKTVVALEEEFFAQGDCERELGLPISPMADRHKDSVAVGQGTFLIKLVLPLLEPIMRCLSDESSAALFDNLHNNKTKWEELMEAHGKGTASFLHARIADVA